MPAPKPIIAATFRLLLLVVDFSGFMSTLLTTSDTGLKLILSCNEQFFEPSPIVIRFQILWRKSISITLISFHISGTSSIPIDIGRLRINK